MSEENWLAIISEKLPDVSAAIPHGTIQAAQLEVAFRSAFNAKPALRECTKLSVCAALVNCAALGIIPETPEQHAYLIPRKSKDSDKKECQLVISYRGFCHMILRGGEVANIDSGVVHDGDDFEFQKGDPVICKFSPNLADVNRGAKPVIGAYCLFVYKNGARKLEIMDAEDLRKIEAAMMRQNFNKMSPAWKEWRDEMCRKAPIKRAAKTSNLGACVAKAAELDNDRVLAALPREEKPLVLASGEVIEPLKELPESELAKEDFFKP